MSIFKPQKVNIRSYPGNANVIGPKREASVGITTTQCRTCTTCLGSRTFYPLTLGSRCTYCAFPCCQCINACDCTVCTQIVPSGMWKYSEQYIAASNCAWGNSAVCSNTPSTFLCYGANGLTNYSNISDCYGNKYSSNRMMSISRANGVTYDQRNNATNVSGSSWYVPACYDFVSSNSQLSYVAWLGGGFCWSLNNSSSTQAWGAYFMLSCRLETKNRAYSRVSRAIKNV